MSSKAGARLFLAAVILCLLGGGGWCAYRWLSPEAKDDPDNPRSERVSAREETPASSDPLQQQLATKVRPFLERYCFSCHGTSEPEAGLDLRRDLTVQAIVANAQQWDLVRQRLQAKSMPPEDAPRQPPPEERSAVIAWLRSVSDREAKRGAGDPGTVLARRLSNAEYDYTIRDLTGVDIRPTREFPVDPANESGFDNSGESLVMSPALLKKYLAAARLVADHVVLKPDGFGFAPHPVVTATDRDKYCVHRIVGFYNRHRVDFADYFLAAWTYRHRAVLGRPGATLGDIAGEAKLSARYLEMVWTALEEPGAARGPMAVVRKVWRELPQPLPKQPLPKQPLPKQPLSPSPPPRSGEGGGRGRTTPHPQPLSPAAGERGETAPPLRFGEGAGGRGEADPRPSAQRLRDLVVRLRKELEPKVTKPSVRGISAGSQPLVLWLNRQLANKRRMYAGDVLPDRKKLADRLRSVDASLAQLLEVDASAEPEPQMRKELERFCSVFPDAFFLSERPPYFAPRATNQGRLLTAGFHLMQGYFRDDEPLLELILDPRERRELDSLWQELNFITRAPIRQYKDFIFFERAEPPRFMREAKFDFARSEDKDCISEAKMSRLESAYLEKARDHKASDEALKAIEDYFAAMRAEIRRIEKAHLEAESSHLDALLAFAERAYRRPLSNEEEKDLKAFYHKLRREDKLDHEEALRDTIASVLMSPHFCYRFVEKSASTRLTDHELASRLSYFFWSSMPDGELLAHAESGDLGKPEVLTAQVRRMLLDSRVRGLATEFAGNWLDFRRFEEHNSVDRDRFKNFTNELRQSMFEEPIRYFVDVVQKNRSILDLLYGGDTFVNRPLAKHYGMPEPPKGEWAQVKDANRYGRGGLLPMAVFMTKNAPGLRTSPVKRGYWVVRRLLGEQIPPPPPTVPELPKDESKLGELTLPQVLARHRDNKSCAGCHRRFDSIGLAFEGFGPIGERRAKDLGGKPVQTEAIFPDGKERKGLAGLRDYLREKRQDDFVDNLCRKLLSYALGRSLAASDKQTLESMRKRLAEEKYAFGSLVESIVTSRQFLNKRGRDESR